jgi:endogenous inhibitor of DNA gyrase (YacG/DUF329 family)
MGKYKKIRADSRRVISEGLVNDSLFDEKSLLWTVSLEGYEWREDQVKNKMLVSITRQRLDSRIYKPQREQGLHLRFAELEHTENDFRGFANQYGLLKVGLGKEGKKPSNDEVHESWGTWHQAHDELRSAVTLSNWINEKVIARYLTTGRGPWESAETSPGGTVWQLANPLDPTKWGGTYFLRESDPEAAATVILLKWINSGLDEATRFRVAWNPTRGKHVLRVMPQSLFGCMWLQMARAFTGEVKYEACRVCGKFLEIGQDAFIVTRVFCSPACKQRDHRKWVKQAKGLAANGMSISKIAKELETTPDVIVNWLSKKK